MQLANFDLRMTAGRQRYPIMFRVSGYFHKSYFTLTTVPGLYGDIIPRGISVLHISQHTPNVSSFQAGDEVHCRVLDKTSHYSN
jgi:hypothetical protein